MLLFKTILKPEEAEGQVMSYNPKTIKMGVPDQAKNFVKEQGGETSAFLMNELVAQTTGVSELERHNFQKRVEKRVLEVLKEVQEKAYKEAYDLGLKDGEKKAYEDSNQDITRALQSLESVISKIAEMKRLLFVENEKHLMETIFRLAEVIAIKEITQDKESVMSVLQKALEVASNEEEIVVRMNHGDLDFINSVKGASGDPFEKFSKVKVEAGKKMLQGGCVIDTNFGIVDASVETRVKKLWESIVGKLPNAEDVKAQMEDGTLEPEVIESETTDTETTQATEEQDASQESQDDGNDEGEKN